MSTSLNFSDNRPMMTVRTISDIRPIEDADAIELAIIDGGWQVVVRKGDFKINDKCFYMEIDSWVPFDLAPFLHRHKDQPPKEYNGIPGTKLKTMKMRGALSQGLVLSIPSDFVQDTSKTLDEQFMIQKWEPVISGSLSGLVRGSFPSDLVPKTDCERIQNLDIENDVIGRHYEITQKMDGTSATYIWNNGDFHVCSRNLSLKWNDPANDQNVYCMIANKYSLKEKMDSFGKNLAIQGEIIGPKIQGNPEKTNEPTFLVFSIFDIDKQKYLLPEERKTLTKKQFQLEHVPVIASDFFPSTGTITENFLTMADGPSLFNPDNKYAEGIVFKDIDDTGFMFKTVSNQFLLKQK